VGVINVNDLVDRRGVLGETHAAAGSRKKNYLRASVQIQEESSAARIKVLPFRDHVTSLPVDCNCPATKYAKITKVSINNRFKIPVDLRRNPPGINAGIVPLRTCTMVYGPQFASSRDLG
jgi:hypothetical protein